MSDTTPQGRRKAAPVITSRLPVVRCDVCRRPMVHQRKKGDAAAVLTAHYNAEHAGELVST